MKMLKATKGKLEYLSNRDINFFLKSKEKMS